jgi:hypothetical protein
LTKASVPGRYCSSQFRKDTIWPRAILKPLLTASYMPRSFSTMLLIVGIEPSHSGVPSVDSASTTMCSCVGPTWSAIEAWQRRR